MFHQQLESLRQYFGEVRLKVFSKFSNVTRKARSDYDSLQVDGQVDTSLPNMPTRRRRVGGDVCAIFVHAGAGFHSEQNERTHLRACEDAAQSAMTFLNNGGEAVDAVEIAIRVLEDKEITNAGWGSNLAMDGTVECDATVVDHYGRSGAVGAVPHIRNPIHLARLVLEHSTKPLSLKRVPPNLLVGIGAEEFAFEQGVPVVPDDDLVSPAAKSRWLRWKSDLKNADIGQESASENLSPHREEMLASCWNESQPYSPRLNGSESLEAGIGPFSHHGSSPRSLTETCDTSIGNDGQGYGNNENIGSTDEEDRCSFIDDDDSQASGFDQPRLSNVDDDDISDTVGAIAVDCLGNIAAGSSSGGIGMKHKGRVGPAALVNVGTAVIPIEINDPKRTSVASVTSGTGEHMGTTLAANLCASRIYSSTRRTKEGGSESTDDDEAMKAFVERDFMGRPSVLHSHSAGAIGVLGVKKTVDGLWLYFAHNTDSFAVASMGSDDLKPRSTMSRNKGDNKVITGGRSIKHWPASRWPHAASTWPANPDSGLNPPSATTDHPGAKRQKTKRIATFYSSRTDHGQEVMTGPKTGT